MASPDLEALVSPKIKAAIEAAIEKVGVKDFLEIAQISNEEFQTILKDNDTYVNVGLVTITCQINKSHGDSDPTHSTVTECLKGTTIRMPRATVPEVVSPSSPRTRIVRSSRTSSGTGPYVDRRSYRLLGFSANTFAFLVLGYFLGGIVLSPIIGQPSCTGLSISPPGLSPCVGSVIGIVVSAIGGLAYTYYYFVRKM
ncbi:MAG TPA: hypothetical protein VFE98_10255 [Candidatus Bathyarchaeia archaeon]|nr:hypothetical protein [Candidatus Bathyarchaeia archaeon]